MKTIMAVCALLLLLLLSCDDINSIHQQYIDRGETLYLGKPDSLVAFSGNNRIKLRWINNSDPKIISTKISWTFGILKDSIILPFNRINPGVQRDSIIIEKLKPNNYFFKIVNIGNENLVSLPSEVVGTSYGESYVSSLISRTAVVKLLSDTKVVLNWNVWPQGCLYSIVKFTTHINGVSKLSSLVIPNEVARVDTLKDIAAGSGESISIQSVFKPEKTAIDLFESTAKQFYLIEIPTNKWKITGFSDAYYINLGKEYLFYGTPEGVPVPPLSDHVVGGPYALIDGNIGTFFHTNWQATERTNKPSWVTFDLGSETTIAQVSVWLRQGIGQVQGPYRIKILTGASDPVLGSPIDFANWTEVGDFLLPKKDGELKFQLANPIKTRKLMLQLLDKTGPNVATPAEFRAYSK